MQRQRCLERRSRTRCGCPGTRRPRWQDQAQLWTSHPVARRSEERRQGFLGQYRDRRREGGQGEDSNVGQGRGRARFRLAFADGPLGVLLFAATDTRSERDPGLLAHLLLFLWQCRLSLCPCVYRYRSHVIRVVSWPGFGSSWLDRDSSLARISRAKWRNPNSMSWNTCIPSLPLLILGTSTLYLHHTHTHLVPGNHV